MDTDPRELLRRHSVLPFATAFMSAKDAGRVEDTLLQGISKGPRSIGSLLRGVQYGLERPKFCRECVREQRQELGESFWRRSHNLPTVHICLRHGLPLWQASSAPLTASQHLTLPLPHRQADAVAQALPPEWSRHPLAEVTDATLRPDWRHQDGWATTYRRLALEHGYRMVSGNVAGARMSAELDAAYGEAYLQPLGLRAGVRQNWASLMVRENETAPFSATKHVVLQTFLRDGRPQLAFDYPKPGPARRDYMEVDKRLASALMGRIKALTEEGGRSSVEALLKGEGAWQVTCPVSSYQ